MFRCCIPLGRSAGDNMRPILAVSGTVLNERPDEALQPFGSTGANQSEVKLDVYPQIRIRDLPRLIHKAHRGFDGLLPKIVRCCVVLFETSGQFRYCVG
jgi:hypothetical protein